jgi:hypothetical protein
MRPAGRAEEQGETSEVEADPEEAAESAPDSRLAA